MSDYDFYSECDELPLFSKVNEQCTIEKTQPPKSEEHSRKLMEILEALKSGPVSCVEVETRWHRGQAGIGELRSRGWNIDTVRGFYYFVGFNGEMVNAKSLQAMYYQSSHWKQTANARKQMDGYRCVQCHSTSNLETHHWRYDLFNEQMEDLCTLCRSCHESIHNAISGSQVHFPRRVTQSVADRIRHAGTGT